MVMMRLLNHCSDVMVQMAIQYTVGGRYSMGGYDGIKLERVDGFFNFPRPSVFVPANSLLGTNVGRETSRR